MSNNKHDYLFFNIKHAGQWPWDKKDSRSKRRIMNKNENTARF